MSDRGISRLESAARRDRRPALICYLPLGDPALSFDLAAIYVEAGVDVIEVGVPSADPHLDGPTVRDSMARSLAVVPDAVAAAELLAEIRDRFPDQAMIWMTYPDTVGSGWVSAVVASGVDGVLFPDHARRHADLASELSRAGLAFAHFIGSPPAEEDLDAAEEASGYVMVQARPGPTGPGDLRDDLGVELETLRQRGVRVPLAVGFGVRDPDGARRVAELGADSVVVGSALVAAALEGPAALRSLTLSLRGALDGI